MNLFQKLFRTQLGWALIAGAVVGTAGTLAFLHTRTPALAETSAAATGLSGNELSVLEAYNNAGVKLVEQVMASIASIETRRGQGSGVVYRRDGYIMTNSHVVSGYSEVDVVLHDGRREKGTVIRDASDFFSDIAIIKVNRNDLRPAVFADSGTVKPGQMAVAVGAPFGLSETATFGHVSALGRSNQVLDRESPEGFRAYFNMIQTDAAINPGNSGGPLMNYKGEVIGINSAINSQTGFNTGVGFAIPANTARIVADQLIEKGKITRAFLGLIPEDLLRYEQADLGIREGAIVRSVDEGPAKEAGIREGDVIVRIGERSIRSEQDVRDAMLLFDPGMTVPVSIVRGGKPTDLNVKLGVRAVETAARPQPAPRGGNLPFGFDIPEREPTSPTPRQGQPGPVQLGVQVRDLAEDERAEAPGGSGVMIVEVQPGSVAQMAGVRAGVILTAIGDARIGNLEDLRNELAKFKPGDSTTVSFGRITGTGRMTMTTTITF